MGAALSLSGFRRPRPEPDDPSSSEEEPPDAKRIKSAPYVLTVLQSSESVTKVLAYTGAGCVLTLETLSATTRATIRGLSLEFEVPTKGRALRTGLILAERAQLLALRRAGTLGDKKHLVFCTQTASEPVTSRSSDVENLRDGVVRFASPRLPVAITTESVLIDVARSEDRLDAEARLRNCLLGQGVLYLDVTMQQGDLLGQRNQARFEADNRSGGRLASPRAGKIDDEVAAELIRAMAPRGADSLPLCLREAATRDYSALSNQPMPDIDRLFEQVSAASAHLDAATLGRISAAYCWRFLLAPPAEGQDAYTNSFADMDAFLSVCQEAGVSARVGRSLWRDALRGSLLPFMPVYSKAGDLGDRPEHPLVRRGDAPLLEMHFFFRNSCCALAVIDRFGDPEAIFGQELEPTLYRERFMVLFGCTGSLALEILRRLKERGAPGAFDAAVACLTSEERLPPLHVGESVLVAPEWADRSITDLPWEPARFARTWLGANALVTMEQTGAEADIPLFAMKRGYASDATPAAARVLCAAAAEGQNEILLRLLQAAPAFKEHAIGFSATRFGDTGSALDFSIAAGNAVGAALFMGAGSGKAMGGSVAAGGLVRTTSRAFRTERAYLDPVMSPELRADLCAAVGMVANLNTDMRFRAPHDISPIERAAARGDDEAVRVALRVVAAALRVASVPPQRWSQRWRSMVDVARARFREETFLATQAAAWGGHASTVRKLLQAQYISEVDDMDDGDAEESRLAALQYAVFQGHAECVEAVLDGWDMSATRALRWALSRAAVCGHAHVIRHLRERGYSLYTPNDTQELTPLGYAARFGQSEAAAALCECPDVARALQENREDNAILCAGDRCHSSVLRVLLETARQEGTTHSWDAFTVCPLAHATIKDDVASVEALLEYDYPMDREGHIHPLFIAATAGRRGMVELLLLKGASAAGSAQMDSALSACMATPVIDCPNVRHSIAQRLLQERPAEVSGSLGMCLLQGVTSNAKLETLRMLLDAGANVGAVFGDDVQPVTHGTTALHHAVYHCVESHKKDADPTYGGEKRTDAEAVVRLLIERGAPLDVQSRADLSPKPWRTIAAGSTPRDIAIACENADVAVAVAAIIDHAAAKRDAARAALLGA